MKSLMYYNWFQNVIEAFISLLLGVCILSCLNVFTTPFDGSYRIYILLSFFLVYIVFVYLSKDKIKELLVIALDKLKMIEFKKMILILIAVMLLIKTVYTLFFFFDPTMGGDIGLYSQLADRILETNSIPAKTISHLAGVGFHLALFGFLHLPYHIGLFFLFLIATVVNFLSFSKFIGKEKSFLLTLLYIVMPSSILLTFCPTHELFVYFYLSLGMALLNKLITEENKGKIMAIGTAITVVISLMIFVSPMGYVFCVILFLSIFLTNTKLFTKAILTLVLLLSVFLSGNASKVIGADEYTTKMNTYVILIHGSNVKSLGEQVDGYPEASIRAKVREMGLEFTLDEMEIAGLEVVKDQYKHLLSHPADLIKLVSHKLYIMWSGDYYPIEMAFGYGGIAGLTYYTMLIVSALIYLIVISAGVVYYRNKKDDIGISNYKLAILGTLAVTVITVVLNKYSIFITIFLYFVCFYRMDIDYEKKN